MFTDVGFVYTDVGFHLNSGFTKVLGTPILPLVLVEQLLALPSCSLQCQAIRAIQPKCQSCGGTKLCPGLLTSHFLLLQVL